jgi:hypothetical protein
MKSMDSSRRSRPWHAVSIVATPASCETARALGATRFLSAEAPRLPLAECQAKDSCACAYRHHADRRGPPRRRDETTGLRRSSQISQERRVTLGRRQSDHA